MRGLLVLLLCALIALTDRAAGQVTSTAGPAPNTTANTAGSPAGTSPGSTTTPAPAVAAPFSYNPEGRRDPFVSLEARGRVVAPPPQAQAPVARPAGLAGLATSEANLRGTIQNRDAVVGIVQGADSKTYIVRSGARLWDGTILTIAPDAMVVLQRVEDPQSLEQEREVRKPLRPLRQEAK